MENIAIIIYSLKGGGAERVASLLSNEFCKKYNLYMIVFDSDDMAYSYGGKLIDINIKSHNNIAMKLINIARRIYKTRKIKKQYNINYSISFLTSANIVNVLSKINDKTIVSIHSNLATNKTGILGVINKWIYSKSYKIVGVSKGITHSLINNYKLDESKVIKIYNPIDINCVEEMLNRDILDRENYFDKEQFIITTMGRLTYAKGQWHLIRALSYVVKEIDNIKLQVLGSGELEGYLGKLVKDLKIEDNVEFLGYKKNPYKYIRRSNLFVFSSLYEGFGNVLIEAMACNISVISTDCKSGPREIIAPRTENKFGIKDIEFAEFGILVPVCDGVQYDHSTPLTEEEIILANSIIEIYRNKDLRKQYSDKGRERVNEFDISIIFKEWEKLVNR